MLLLKVCSITGMAECGRPVLLMVLEGVMVIINESTFFVGRPEKGLAIANGMAHLVRR